MISPAFLDELARFDTVLKRRISGVFAGEQESPTVGEGRIFSDYRRYARGDDTRLIDWKVFGRTDELFVKQFEAERDLTMHVLVDASGSMDYGDDAAHKFEYAAKLGLGFAYLAVEENNDFRFSVFDESVERLDGGRTNRGEILALIDRCNEVEPGGQAAFGQALTQYASSIRSRSLVLVVSDFLDEPGDVEAGLVPLSTNDVTLAHVLAPGERDPPARGDTVFRALESALRRRTYFGGRLRRAYQDRLEAHVADVARRGDALGARHVAVDTGDDFFESFVRVWPD